VSEDSRIHDYQLKGDPQSQTVEMISCYISFHTGSLHRTYKKIGESATSSRLTMTSTSSLFSCDNSLFTDAFPELSNSSNYITLKRSLIIIRLQVIQMPFSDDLFTKHFEQTAFQFLQTMLFDKLVLFPWY
jgi:hypothetical protein